MDILRKHCLLIANGPFPNFPIPFYNVLIAVDGGYNHCKQLGLIPDITIGDFDSSSPPNPTYQFPTEKDETDLEIALRLLKPQNQQSTTILSAVGGRIDHTLVNLHLLRRYPELITIETEDEKLFAIKHHATIPTSRGQRLSIIPLGETTVTTEGLKWNLNSAPFDHTHMSVSNIALSNSVTIEATGFPIICLEK